MTDSNNDNFLTCLGTLQVIWRMGNFDDNSCTREWTHWYCASLKFALLPDGSRNEEKGKEKKRESGREGRERRKEGGEDKNKINREESVNILILCSLVLCVRRVLGSHTSLKRNAYCPLICMRKSMSKQVKRHSHVIPTLIQRDVLQ